MAKFSLGCIRQSISSRSREVILPFCSLLVRLHLKCWVQFCASQFKRDLDIAEHLSCEERLIELGVLSWRRGSLRGQGDLTNVYKYLKKYFRTKPGFSIGTLDKRQ